MLRDARSALERLQGGEYTAIEDLRRYAESYRELLVQHTDRETTYYPPWLNKLSPKES